MNSDQDQEKSITQTKPKLMPLNAVLVGIIMTKVSSKGTLYLYT